MVEERTIGDRLFDGIINILLLITVVVCIYPMLYVLFASLSDPKLLVKHSGLLFKPLGFSLKGYELVLKNPNIQTGYLNTIFYVGVGTFFNVIMTALGAYLISRKRFLWKRFIVILIVLTMYFNGGLIPTYLLVKNIGLLDSRWALILPNLISTYNMIVMRTGFASVPDSLEESAKLDGASDVRILFQIYIPVSKAIVAVMVLFYAVEHWNAWFDAMIYLHDRSRYPLQMVLREILISSDVSSMDTGNISALESDDALYKMLVKYCTIIVATLPILCLYPFLQKYFIKGVMIGSIKG